MIKRILRRLPGETLRRRSEWRVPPDILGEYLVTTDKGVIHISKGWGRFLTAAPGYGIAICDEKVFLSYENNDLSSRLIELPADELLSGWYKWTRRFRGKEHYRLNFSSSNGRIHQVTASPAKDEIFISASADNSIVNINLNNHNIVYMYPFSDQFGAPIKSFDHNNINSAIKIESFIYFVAYKAGNHSLAGYIAGDGNIFGWKLGSRGFHDVFPSETGFVTCDTFGDAAGGSVLTENGVFESVFFEENSFAPGGVAGTAEEIVVGHSHKGPRAKRFSGNGGLIFKNGRRGNPFYVELPVAPIYQIIHRDGHYLAPLADASHDRMSRSLEKRFGPPEYLGKVHKEPAEAGARD